MEYRGLIGVRSLRTRCVIRPTISDEDLLAGERVGSNRQQQARCDHCALCVTAGQLAADVPLLVGGDWNCPSHLDWTVDAARVYKRRRVLPLPVSTAMQQAGFMDTFRVLYPNPVQRPGLTWSPMFRTKDTDAGQVEQGFERIDRLYLKNPVPRRWRRAAGCCARCQVTCCRRSGSTNRSLWVDRTFPSDHGAVVIDLVWERQR